jgi:rhamnulokinase/L-fuculokinase
VSLPLISGPVEATAIGNAALQAVATGELDSPLEARGLIRRCAQVAIYEPGNRRPWDDAYGRFLDLVRG